MLGNLERQRLDAQLAQRLRGDAALAHARRFLGAEQVDRDRRVDRLVEADLLQVDVRDAAAHRVHLVVLEDRRVRAAGAVDLDVEDRVEARGARERAAQLALGDRDRDRLAAPVEHAGDEPLLAQAARLARAQVAPRGDDQLGALSGHSAAECSGTPVRTCSIRTCSRSCCRRGTARRRSIRFDRESGAWMFVCVHSTVLGPAGGGTRLRVYPRPGDGLADAMQLSQAMTQKMAAAGVPRGGGKARARGARACRRARRAGALLLRYAELVDLARRHLPHRRGHEHHARRPRRRRRALPVGVRDDRRRRQQRPRHRPRRAARDPGERRARVRLARARRPERARPGRRLGRRRPRPRARAGRRARARLRPRRGARRARGRRGGRRGGGSRRRARDRVRRLRALRGGRRPRRRDDLRASAAASSPARRTTSSPSPRTRSGSTRRGSSTRPTT